MSKGHLEGEENSYERYPKLLSSGWIPSSRATFFDELGEDGEVTPSRSQGASLSAWEDLEGEEPNLTLPPPHPRPSWPSKQANNNKRPLPIRQADSLHLIKVYGLRPFSRVWAPWNWMLVGGRGWYIKDNHAEHVLSQDRSEDQDESIRSTSREKMKKPSQFSWARACQQS